MMRVTFKHPKPPTKWRKRWWWFRTKILRLKPNYDHHMYRLRPPGDWGIPREVERLREKIDEELLRKLRETDKMKTYYDD